MNNITINGLSNNLLGETPVTLTNGSIVLHYLMGNLLNAYIVIPYRGTNDSLTDSNSKSYCSLLNLSTWSTAFKEKARRHTNIQKILSHLSEGQFTGREAVVLGHYIEVYKPDEFKLDLQFNKGDK